MFEKNLMSSNEGTILDELADSRVNLVTDGEKRVIEKLYVFTKK